MAATLATDADAFHRLVSYCWLLKRLFIPAMHSVEFALDSIHERGQNYGWYIIKLKKNVGKRKKRGKWLSTYMCAAPGSINESYVETHSSHSLTEFGMISSGSFVYMYMYIGNCSWKKKRWLLTHMCAAPGSINESYVETHTSHSLTEFGMIFYIWKVLWWHFTPSSLLDKLSMKKNVLEGVTPFMSDPLVNVYIYLYCMFMFVYGENSCWLSWWIQLSLSDESNHVDKPRVTLTKTESPAFLNVYVAIENGMRTTYQYWLSIVRFGELANMMLLISHSYTDHFPYIKIP